MNTLMTIILWCILFVLCWPLALLALILWPFVWVLSIPLRLINISLDIVFALLSFALYLPLRLLGLRRTA